MAASATNPEGTRTVLSGSTARNWRNRTHTGTAGRSTTVAVWAPVRKTRNGAAVHASSSSTIRCVAGTVAGGGTWTATHATCASNVAGNEVQTLAVVSSPGGWAVAVVTVYVSPFRTT